MTRASWQLLRTCAVVVVIGMVGSAIGSIICLRAFAFYEEGAMRFLAPGEEVLSLEGGRTYNIFVEYESQFDGVLYSASLDQLTGLRCGIRSQGGATVPIQDWRGRFSYTSGRAQAQAFWRVQPVHTGKYHVAVTYLGDTGPKVVIAVVRDQTAAMILWAVVGIVLTLGVLAIAALMMWRGWSRWAGSRDSQPGVT